MIESYTCSACGGSRFHDDEDGNLICYFCGTTYELASQKYLCRVCNTLNPVEASRCMRCGSALGRQCPICTHLNAPGATVCEECETPLDVYTSIGIRAPQAGETERRVERLVRSKWSDAVYMRGQRARLDAEERERLAGIAAQASANRRQQWKIIVLTGIGIALFIAGLIVLAVLFGA